MLIAVLMLAEAPAAVAPLVTPSVVSAVKAKTVTPNDVCPPGAPAGIIVQGGRTAQSGIIVQGGLQPSADAGIIVQGGKTAGAGIIVQGGLQPSGPSDAAAKEKCDKPKR